MTAPEHLGRYQFGRYLFTREPMELEDQWVDEDSTAEEATGYRMFREPNRDEEMKHGSMWAPALDVGSMSIHHEPPERPLPQRFDVRTRQPRSATSAEYAAETRNRGWNAAYAHRDVVDYLRVAKDSRLMVPTMLGMANLAARKTTGGDVLPSHSLSEHSQRLVGRLQAGGLVSKSHEFQENPLDFLPAHPAHVPGGLEGLFSDIIHARHMGYSEARPVPKEEVAAGREHGREIVRRSRPGARSRTPRVA